MSFHQLVCLSNPNPAVAAHEIAAVCHGFPSRQTQSGVSGKLIAMGEQFVLLLEGQRLSIERLVQRIQAEIPEAGLTIRGRRASDDRAFRSWSIRDVYLDELQSTHPTAAAQLEDRLIDLLATSSIEVPGYDDEPAEHDLFAEVAELIEQATGPTTSRRLAAAA
ncbi:MAG: BLUF domain-containing protein [Planctomycetota bacterium]